MKTYGQRWPAYNRAQVNEKIKFQWLLYQLCKGLDDFPREPGRPRAPLADMIFATCFKVYSTFSGRRFGTDLREAYEKGFLSRPISYNSLFDYFNLKCLKPYLTQLIEQSSKTLREVEIEFAVDASGLSTRCYERWLHNKYKNPQIIDKLTWRKLHIMVGVKTHIVTAVEVTEGTKGDSPQFETLFRQSAKNFPIQEVSADKAYLGRKNLRLVLEAGAMPYIPFKVDSNPSPPWDKTGMWKRLYHYYMCNQELFMQHYHKRSNVETTFSMIKAKFGPYLRSRTEVAQTNEALCKVLCHNICVVIQSIYELGIEPNFWPDGLPGQDSHLPEKATKGRHLPEKPSS